MIPFTRFQALRSLWGPWLLCALAAVALAMAGRSMLQAVDGRFYDIGITSREERVPDEIVIVGINEEFMRGRHAYLTPRDRLARLIEILVEVKPAAIAVDVWLDSRIDDEPEGVDAQLRRALLKAKSQNVPVVLADLDVQDDAQANPEYSGQTGLTAHGAALPYFTLAAFGTGSVRLEPAGDGIVRDFPVGTESLPALPMAVLRAAGKNFVLPQNEKFIPIDFYGPPNSTFIQPADKLLQEPYLAALLADKIVFIGATYPRSQDFLDSPFEYSRTGQQTELAPRKMYGVEVLAQATATVLRGSPRRSHESTQVVWKIAAATFLAALLVAAMGLRGAAWGVGAAVLVILGAGGVGYASAQTPPALWGYHFWPPSAFLLAAPLAAGLSVGYRQITQAAELRLVRDAFGAYVGEEVLRQMGGKMPELGGETRDIAVLFCDIQGYTALAESLRDDPEALMAALNEHFRPLVGALKERGAYADNYVGDLVMALFGAPVSRGNLADDTAQAVLAAVDFVRIVEERNQARRAAGEVPIEVGIGVHCGVAVVGNLGTERKIHYTAIGDVVNIASRVESATRNYEVSLLVTEETMQACHERPETRGLRWEFVDETHVKNRQAPVRLYRVESEDICNGATAGES